MLGLSKRGCPSPAKGSWGFRRNHLLTASTVCTTVLPIPRQAASSQSADGARVVRLPHWPIQEPEGVERSASKAPWLVAESACVRVEKKAVGTWCVFVLASSCMEVLGLITHQTGLLAPRGPFVAKIGSSGSFIADPILVLRDVVLVQHVRGRRFGCIPQD